MTIPFETVHAEMLRDDPAYRAAYDESGPRMELAFAMAEARASAGLSQGEVAQRMKTSQARVSQWERGRERPSTATLEKFAAATGAKLEVRLVIPKVTGPVAIERGQHFVPAGAAMGAGALPERSGEGADAARRASPPRRKPAARGSSRGLADVSR